MSNIDSGGAFWEEIGLINLALYGDGRENPPGGLVNEVKQIKAYVAQSQAEMASMALKIAELQRTLDEINDRTRRTETVYDRFPPLLYLLYRNAPMVFFGTLLFLQLAILSSIPFTVFEARRRLFGDTSHMITFLIVSIAVNTILVLLSAYIGTRQGNGNGGYRPSSKL